MGKETLDGVSEMAKAQKKWLRCSASGRIIAYVGMKRWGDLGEWHDEMSQRVAQRWLETYQPT